MRALTRALTDACDTALRAMAVGVAVETVDTELRRRLATAHDKARHEAAERIKKEQAA